MSVQTIDTGAFSASGYITQLRGDSVVHLAAATPAVANRFVVSVNMKVGLYTLANNTMPTPGGRLVTVAATAVGAADTMGTITIAGTDLAGEPQSENIAPVAGSTVSGALVFKTVTSVTGAGWVIAEGNDTVVVGCAAGAYVASTAGVLDRITVNTTAAGAITVTDGSDTVAILKASVAEGSYAYGVAYASLKVDLAGASDVTIAYHAS